MKIEEYKAKLSIIESDYKMSKKQLAIECSRDNNIVNIGDIVTDHIGCLLVENIAYGSHTGFDSMPTCVYYGKRLTKKGIPILRGDNSPAHQVNLTPSSH